jgi:hypothetical protein
MVFFDQTTGGITIALQHVTLLLLHWQHVTILLLHWQHAHPFVAVVSGSTGSAVASVLASGSCVTYVSRYSLRNGVGLPDVHLLQ